MNLGKPVGTVSLLKNNVHLIIAALENYYLYIGLCRAFITCSQGIIQVLRNAFCVDI